MSGCAHFDEVRFPESAEPVAGCEEGLRTGDGRVHLRMCHTCGTIRCCDSSLNGHAGAHVREAGHTLVRPVESGEDRSWCYVDQVMPGLSAA